MGKKLASTVYVRADNGQVTRHPPGTPHTAKLGAAITNESAWVEEDPAPAAEEAPEPPAPPEPPENPENQTPTSEETLEAPPRSGNGSGRDAWVAYAERLEVQVPEGASRDDIIAFLEERELIAPEQA
jgi:hypothetical protein